MNFDWRMRFSELSNFKRSYIWGRLHLVKHIQFFKMKFLFLLIFLSSIFCSAQVDLIRYVEQHVDSPCSVVWLKSDVGPEYCIVDQNKYTVAYRSHNKDGRVLFDQFNLDSLSIRVGYDSSGIHLNYFSVQSCIDSIGFEFRFDSNGKLSNIQQGIVEPKGFRRSYYPNGALEYVGCIINNKRYGSYYHYFPNGKLESAAYFDNQGFENGEEIFYYENQSINSIVELANGRPNGRMYRFDVNGDLLDITNWVNGVFVDWEYKRN